MLAHALLSPNYRSYIVLQQKKQPLIKLFYTECKQVHISMETCLYKSALYLYPVKPAEVI